MASALTAWLEQINAHEHESAALRGGEGGHGHEHGHGHGHGGGSRALVRQDNPDRTDDPVLNALFKVVDAFTTVLDVGGAILAISQFTLYGDCSNGRRPFFGSAADPAAAEQLYEAFITRLLQVHQLTVASGIFGAHMDLEIHNDGPVTILVDSPVSA